MEAINYSLVIDIVLVGLLAVVLIWLVKVNWTLSRLRNSRGELAQLLGQFTAATQRAKESTGHLKNLGHNTLKTIETASEKGKKLYDDLSYLIERGTKMADHLEVTISQGRQKIPEKSQRKSDFSDVKAEPADLVSGIENLR